jgi:uncharacterized protein YigE (DUF2233 family)
MFRTLLLLPLLLLPALTSLRAADWSAEGRERLPLPAAAASAEGLEAVQVRLAALRPEVPPVTAHVILFRPGKFTLKVVDDPDVRHGNLRQAMEKIGALAGVNGGYFHPDYTPLGLVVSGGKVLHAQENAKLLSGLFVATPRNLALARPAEFRLGKTTIEALQAGPFLVDAGNAVPGLNNDKKARRTIVVTLADGRWALVSLSSVTLAQAGALLATDLLWPGTEPERALNLDGGSSTGLYLAAPTGGKPLYLAEFGRVRNYLALVPR